MSESVQVLQQANTQRDHAKRATFDALKGKRRKTAEHQTVLEDGAEPISFKLVAMISHEYDDLVTAHPPTPEQKKKALDQGLGDVLINEDTFPPALLAEVCVEPKLTAEQWSEAVFNNDSWNGAERMSLFWAANGLCRQGLSLTPFE